MRCLSPFKEREIVAFWRIFINRKIYHSYALLKHFPFTLPDPADFPQLEQDEVPMAAKPILTQETLRLRSVCRKKAGDNFRLVCEALGKPEPQMVWYRNGQELSPSDGVDDFSRPGNGRAVLSIRRVKVVDTGLYTCKAINEAGVATRNFTLDVMPDRSHKQPVPNIDNKGLAVGTDHKLTMTGPANTTVDQGSTAVLECRVESPIQSEIMWLKQLEQGSAGIVDNKDIFEIGKDKFKLLEQTGDGNLVIEETKLQDARNLLLLCQEPHWLSV